MTTRSRLAQTVLTARRRLAVARGRVKDYSSVMTVGEHTYGAEHIVVHAWPDQTHLRIGRFCSIADGVHVFLGGNHRHDWVSMYPLGPASTPEQPRDHIPGVSPYSKGDVAIGNDVWVGSHASIMSGVTIGDGAVVAAFAHVVKDVAPYTIVGGNPARCIGQRFDEQTSAQIRALAWWDWPIDKVLRHRQLLLTEPTAEVLARLRDAQ